MNFVDSPRRAWAELDLDALTHNLSVARKTCPDATYLPIIKANGYGHGLEAIAGQLMKDTTRLEGVAVAAMSEARRLRDCGVSIPVILLPGFLNQAELTECQQLNVDPVVHSKYQVKLLLDQAPEEVTFRRIWLKANTGMNRLGMNTAEWREARQAILNALPQIVIVAMSHLACADDPSSPATPSQVQRFEALLPDIAGRPPRRTLAASGGILGWPQTHFDIVRPGIMMYGSSPLGAKTAVDLGLRPVMTFCSRIIAVNSVQAGDAVGYGEAFIADKSMRIGVVSIGYGDGYPRQAPSGTPLLVQTSHGMERVPLAGRVSMDMITVDLTSVQGDPVQPGAMVVLWGRGLPAEEIAALCGTISYELFCQVTPRVPRIASN